jgi:small subunit ribosomal protein S4
MIRKKNKYVKPRKMFEAERIKEENILVEKYGLKNKKEVWKAQAKVDYYRGRAKTLSKKPIEEQEVFFNKMRALGLETENTADVLGLKVENILERRLPTILVKKKLANAPKQGRQMVTHKRVMINRKVMSSPSYLVPLSEENQITIKQKEKKLKVKKEETKEEEKPEEVKEKES